MNWHIVNLPDYFTSLLKLNLQDHDKAYRAILGSIRSNDILGAVISQNFGGGHLESILQSVGWFGFREQLAAHFMDQIEESGRQGKAERSSVRDLVTFEERYKDHATSGYSRAFLFAMYIRSAYGGDALGYFQDDLYSLLQHSKSKVVKIDWTLAMLAHFDEYLGRRGMESILNDGIEFEDIFNFLKESQKEEMLSNLLAYGCSIDEPSIFMNDTV